MKPPLAVHTTGHRWAAAKSLPNGRAIRFGLRGPRCPLPERLPL